MQNKILFGNPEQTPLALKTGHCVSVEISSTETLYLVRVAQSSSAKFSDHLMFARHLVANFMAANN